MRLLVTGASGFVGSAVARAARAAGHRVRVLVRRDSDRRALQGLDLDYAVGDLASPDAVHEAAAGCGAILHVAGDYRLWARDSRALYRTNVDGTRHVLTAAYEAGAARVVHTSSVATLGLPASGAPGDEDTPVALADMIGHYKRSKYLAEQAALDFAREHGGDGPDVVVVNPSAPVGPRDHKPTPTGRLVLDAASGRMPAYVDTGLNVVHVDDVAAGHLLALERGVCGRRYVLGGDDMTLAAILAEIAELTGGVPPRIRLPHGLVLPMAHAAEAWARLSGQVPRLTVDGARLARKRMFFSSARARSELGYRTRPARDALADAVEWYREHGYMAAVSSPKPGTET